MATILSLSVETLGQIAKECLQGVYSSYERGTRQAPLGDDMCADDDHELERLPACLSFLPEPETTNGNTSSTESTEVAHPQPGALSTRAQKCIHAPDPSARTISLQFPFHDVNRRFRTAARAAPRVGHKIMFSYPFWFEDVHDATATEYPWDLDASEPLCSCALPHVVRLAGRCRVLHAIFPGRGGQTPRTILSAFRAANACILEHMELYFDAWPLTYDDSALEVEILEVPSIQSSRTLNSSFIVSGRRLTVLHVAAQSPKLRVKIDRLCEMLAETPELEELVLQSALMGPTGSSSDPITLPLLRHFYFQDRSETWRLFRLVFEIPDTCPSVHLELVSNAAPNAFNLNDWNELCSTLREDELIPPFAPIVGIADITRDARDTLDNILQERRWPELVRFTVSETYEGAAAWTDCLLPQPRWSVAIRNGLIAPQGTVSHEIRAQFIPPLLEHLIANLIRALHPTSTAGVTIFSVHSRLDRWLPNYWLEILETMGRVETIVAHDITDGDSMSLESLAQNIGRVRNERGELYLHPLSRQITELILPDWTAEQTPQAEWNALMQSYYRPPAHFPVRCARTFRARLRAAD